MSTMPPGAAEVMSLIGLVGHVWAEIPKVCSKSKPAKTNFSRSIDCMKTPEYECVIL
jgi:hypothetical protein